MSKITQFKRTGIEWISEIPIHWELWPIKHQFEIGRGRVISQNELKEDGRYPVYSSQTFEDGVLGFINSYDFDEELLTWTTDGVNAGSVFHRSGKFNTTNVCGTLKSITEFNIRYQYYALMFIAPKCKRPDTNGAKIMNNEMAIIKIPIPPIHEQITIANYLDLKCAQINNFITKKQAFIDFLKEQRQSIINDAVTKGINKKTTTKELSLGTLPKNWSSKRLKFIADVRFSNVDKHTHKEETPVRLCNYVDVYKNDYITNDMELMNASATDNEISRFKVFKGDIIITKDSETSNDIAVSALVTQDLENVVCGYHLALIRADETQILSEFLFRKFQSKEVNAHFEVEATGVTRVGLSMGDITGVTMSYPNSLQEQKEIVEFIKTETVSIDTAIAKTTKEIDLIKEYKEALISEAVTGKINLNN